MDLKEEDPPRYFIDWNNTIELFAKIFFGVFICVSFFYYVMVAFNFDVEKLINLPCLISLKKLQTKKGTDFMKLGATSPMMKGQVAKEAFNPLKVLNYAEKWDDDYFRSLPEFIRFKMMDSDEFKNLKGIVEPKDETEEIPF